MTPDIDDEVKDELQELNTHDDGNPQVQAEGTSQAGHKARFLKKGKIKYCNLHAHPTQHPTR